MMARRAIGWFIMAMMVVWLAACGSQNEGTETPPGNTGTETPQTENTTPQTPAPQPQQPKEPVVLNIVTNAGHTEESFNMRFGDSIRKKFSDYTINYIPSTAVKFDDLVVTNTQVDIVYAAIIDFTRGPFKNEMVYDMTELAKQQQVDLSRISIDWMSGLMPMWDNKLYGLPVSVETLTLFYNQDIFDKFGVDYPVDLMTWDEVFDLNNRMTRKVDGTQYAGLTIGVAQHFSLNALSLPFVDPESGKSSLSKLESEWKSLYEAYAVRPFNAPGYRDKFVELGNKVPAEAQFRNQEAAMLAGLVHSPLSWKELETFNWDMVTYPTFAERPNSTAQGNLLLLGVTNMSKFKNEAMEVIGYLITDEFQKTTSADGNLPVVINEETTKVFAQNTYYKDRNVQSAFLLPWAPLSTRSIYDSDMGALYRKYLVQLASGEMDMNTMLRTVEEEVNLKLDELKMNN